MNNKNPLSITTFWDTPYRFPLEWVNTYVDLFLQGCSYHRVIARAANSNSLTATSSYKKNYLKWCKLCLNCVHSINIIMLQYPLERSGSLSCHERKNFFPPLGFCNQQAPPGQRRKSAVCLLHATRQPAPVTTGDVRDDDTSLPSVNESSTQTCLLTHYPTT